MRIDDIHWHDSQIRRVVETPGTQSVAFEVDYPIDWDNNLFEPREILFNEVYAYEIHEGPFSGSPTILSAAVSQPDQFGVFELKLETNAGYRLIRCRGLTLGAIGYT